MKSISIKEVSNEVDNEDLEELKRKQFIKEEKKRKRIRKRQAFKNAIHNIDKFKLFVGLSLLIIDGTCLFLIILCIIKNIF